MKKSTSWGAEALVGEYQKNLILPNLLRLLEIKTGETILDLGCGSGFFAREFFKKGARVIGIDISEELIAEAEKNSPKTIEYHTASADNLPFLKDGGLDKATLVLAIQNMENADAIFQECARLLKPGGKLLIVMNHPVFRVPKQSSWGWDEEKKIQYRRVDRYLSESKEKIQMHPSATAKAGQASSGQAPSEYTVSFHRPLQLYFKFLNKAGFCVSRLEEWISDKKSEPGPRAKAENIARKEIPLFLFLEAVL